MTTEDDSYWRFVESIWDTVSIYDGGAPFLDQISKVTEKQKVLFCAHWAQSEICNGGLYQFFYNSTGVLAPEAVLAFQALGLPACATAIEQAMRYFGEQYPRDRDIRIDRLEEYQNEDGDDEDGDPFMEEDDMFWDGLGDEDDGFESAADNYANKG